MPTRHSWHGTGLLAVIAICGGCYSPYYHPMGGYPNQMQPYPAPTYGAPGYAPVTQPMPSSEPYVPGGTPTLTPTSPNPTTNPAPSSGPTPTWGSPSGTNPPSSVPPAGNNAPLWNNNRPNSNPDRKVPPPTDPDADPVFGPPPSNKKPSGQLETPFREGRSKPPGGADNNTPPSDILQASATEDQSPPPNPFAARPAMPADPLAEADPTRFGFDAENYRWVKGTVDYNPQDKSWHVIYNVTPGPDDKFAGDLTLLPDPRLDSVADNDFVQIEGQLDATQPDQHGKPSYKITRIRKLTLRK